MRSAFLPAALLALLLPVLLLVPVMVPAVCADARDAGWYYQPVPPVPNISFPNREPAAGSWYELGFRLTTEERYSEAVTAYEHALSENRSLVNAWYYLGDALFRLGRDGEAILAFENATAVDPDFVEAYLYESQVFRRLGRSTDEREAAERGLEAADRRMAGEGALPPGASGGRLFEPVPPVIPLLAASFAIGLQAYRRRGRGG